MIEIFKEIPGYEGKYWISNLGRVKSLSKRSRYGKSDDGFYYTLGFVDGAGYRQVSLRTPKHRFSVRVHALVAEGFCPRDREDRTFVNHKDGNKLNNHFENLEWVTPGENIAHAIAIGLIDHRGEKSPMALLTDRQVMQIRKLYFYHTHKQIGEIFGISRRHIGDIINGVCWKHLPTYDYTKPNPK